MPATLPFSKEQMGPYKEVNNLSLIFDIFGGFSPPKGARPKGRGAWLIVFFLGVNDPRWHVTSEPQALDGSPLSCSGGRDAFHPPTGGSSHDAHGPGVVIRTAWSVEVADPMPRVLTAAAVAA